MSRAHCFYFFSLRTAIRYHIAKRLIEQGWTRVNCESEAVLSDRHLSIDDEVSKYLEYKHLLAALIKKYRLSIAPLTYCIQDENYAHVIAEAMYDNHIVCASKHSNVRDKKWILKPSMLNNGDHIKLFNCLSDVSIYYHQRNRLGGDHVLQQYIHCPDLFEGKKYTYRIPVIVTNFSGIYLYREGYINVSVCLFDKEDTMQNKKMHVTNYVLEGELSHIQQHSTTTLPDFPQTYTKMVAIVQAVFEALLKEYPHYLTPGTTRRFEIFGFDFIMDADKRLWLLEINQGPDAPMYEENLMKSVMWDPFWERLMQAFVIPVAQGSEMPECDQWFHRILPASKPTSFWKRLIKISNAVTRLTKPST